MAHAEFVHLHLHTEYSLLDGACRLDRLMEKAHELKFPSIAITDHGVLYGAIDFYQAAREKGLKPIIGCEVYVAPGSRLDKKATSGGRDVYNHLVLLAKDEVGYKNLIKLATAAHLEGYYYKPRIDKELLSAHHEGLIALSGCLASEISESILKDQLPKARAAIDWFKQTLGPENFYLELQNHGIPEQAKVNRHLIPWAKEFGLKLVATNDVHYLEQSHSHAHDCLICIGTQTLLSDTKRMKYVEQQFYLRSAEEMSARFAETPEAVRNTLEVAEKCNLEIQFGKLHYPVFAPPEHFTREGYLRVLLGEGLRKRYGMQVRVEAQNFVLERVEDPRKLPTYKEPQQKAGGTPGLPSEEAASAAAKDILDRLGHELAVIEKTGFTSYFLIVGDFVRYGHEKGVACVARGSAAGSIVTYLLGISNVDPIRYGLLFERFLNPERVNPPDIDIDFADDRRADVIEYVRQKYGEDAVAQIVTFGTMGAKSVVRDVGRVMGLSYGECDRLAKMIPFDLKMSLEKALKQSPELKQAYGSEEVTRELIDTAMALEDLARNASVHAAGVVIGDQPLVNLLPLKRDEDGGVVTQYAMGPVGDLGLLKMDFLGLKTLTVIRNTCELVRQTRRIEVPIDNLPLDDHSTYDLLNKANTLGVFQLESGGMRDLCRKFQISSLEHITALIALYRPGPMDLIPEFIGRRHGEVMIEYAHPLLEPICRETYGIMVYQEQVMQAAQALAGYTLGGADLLRRAMGKKKPEEMAKQRDIFVKGASRVNSIPAAKANQIFDLLEKFAGYGFNKSHAAAYAIVAYQTAYLKANYPVEFFCAMMTNDMGDTEKLSQYIAEARGMGIEVLPPDVNESQVYFAPAPGPELLPGTNGHGKANGNGHPVANGGGSDSTQAIRFGLAAIKGVGEVAVQAILKGRTEGGKFQSLAELCERMDSRTLNRKVLEGLIKCGACDCFGRTRATLFSQIDRTLGRAASIISDRQRGQSSLFGALEDHSTASVAEPQTALPEWPDHELLACEKELLGFYVTGHPLTPYAPILQKYSLATTKSLGQLQNRALTRLGGMIAALQNGISKKNGKPYSMVTLEDLEGAVQVLCMNENYDRNRELLVQGKAIFVIGEVNTGEDRPKIFPQEIMALDDVPRRFTKQVHLRLHTAHLTPESIESVRDLVAAHPGKCPLLLCFVRPGGEVIFLETHERFGVTPSRALQTETDHLFGEDTYYVKVDTTLPERAPRKWERRSEEGGGKTEARRRAHPVAMSSKPGPPHQTARPSSQLLLLARVNALQAWRRLKSVRDQSRLLTGIILLFICGYMTLSFWLFYRGLTFISAFPGLGSVLTERLLYLLFALLFALLLLSNLVISYTNFFRNREAAFLMSLPVPWETIFRWKFIESTLIASWAFLFLIAPFLVAFGLTRAVPWHFYAVTIVLVGLFIVLPGVAGSWLAVSLARYLDRRTFRYVAVAGAILLLVTARSWWRVPPTSDEVLETRVLDMLDQLLFKTRFTQFPFLPSYWLSTSVIQWGEGVLNIAGFFMLVLLSHVTFFGFLTFTRSGKPFYAGASAVQSRGSGFGDWEWLSWRRGNGAAPSTGPCPPGALERLLAWCPWIANDVRALLVKDTRAFWRDTAQWGQSVMLFGLLGAYIVNLRSFTQQLTNPFWVNLVSYLNLGACSLNLATLTTRFVFPQFSLEGKRLWIIGMAPMGLAKVVRAKYWLASLGSLIVTLSLMVLSSYLLKMSWHRIVFFGGVVGVMTFSLNGLAVGLGVLYPNFKDANPSKIVSGFGGTLCLVLSFLYILASVLLLGFGTTGHHGHWGWVAASICGFVLVSLAIGWLPLKLGLAQLRHLEI